MADAIDLLEEKDVFDSFLNEEVMVESYDAQAAGGSKFGPYKATLLEFRKRGTGEWFAKVRPYGGYRFITTRARWVSIQSLDNAEAVNAVLRALKGGEG